jgi:YVTN family beta-propeller protein
VMDAASHAVLARIKVGDNPQTLCLNTASDKVYCGLRDADMLKVIDGTTNAVVDSIPVGDGPIALCYNPTNNKVYAANYGDSTVSAVDCAADTVVATVMAGRYPYRMTHNPQQNKLYVTVQADHELTVLDCAADTVVALLDISSGSQAVLYSARTGLAYVGSGSRSLFIVDGEADTIRHTIEAVFRNDVLAADPAGGRVYGVSAYASAVSVIVDSLTGIEESPKPQASSRKPEPTIVRGVLMLGAVDSRQQTGYRAELLDVSGRRVAALQTGANDVRGLAPGVYFVRGVQPQAIHKLVITR